MVRGTSILVIVLIIDAFLYFGMGSVASELGGHVVVEQGNRTFLAFWNASENGTDWDNTEPDTADSSFIGALLNLDIVGAAFAVLDATGVSNIAQPMLTVLNEVVSFFLAPYNFVVWTGLESATGGMAHIFSASMFLMLGFALWKILVGRDV